MVLRPYGLNRAEFPCCNLGTGKPWLPGKAVSGGLRSHLEAVNQTTGVLSPESPNNKTYSNQRCADY